MTWINVRDTSMPYVTVNSKTTTYSFYFNTVAHTILRDSILSDNYTLSILIDADDLSICFEGGESYKCTQRANGLELSAGRTLSGLGLSRVEKESLRGIKIPLKVDEDGVPYIDLSPYIKRGV